MYGFWQVVIILLVAACTWLFLKSCSFIIPVHRTKFISVPVFATLPLLLWIAFSPLYNGLPFTQLSEARSPIEGNHTVRPWGDTFECYPAYIKYPATLLELRDVVKKAKNVRVVGGGHSFSPLICTNETLISLKNMTNITEITNTTVTAYAGASIESVMSALLPKGRVLHGFGSVQDQTLAGAFSTSQHGLQRKNFAYHVVEVSAVLADGTLFKTTNLTYWKASLGLLGVIYEMKLNTHAETMVRVERLKMHIDDALEGLYKAEGGCVWASWNGRLDQVILNRYTSVSDPIVRKYPVQTHQFESMMLDTVAMPILSFFPPLADVNLMFLYAENTTTVKHISSAWSHHAEYGLMYTAYIVPKQHCKTVLKEIEYSGQNVVNILVRFVEKEEVGCLSLFQQDSCVIDIYSLQFQPTLRAFHSHVEKVVGDYGGHSHWGKFMVTNNQTRNLSCFSEFQAYVRAIDPEGKFQNNYTTALFHSRPPVYENFNRYTAGVFVWRWFTVFLFLWCAFAIFFDRINGGPVFKRLHDA